MRESRKLKYVGLVPKIPKGRFGSKGSPQKKNSRRQGKDKGNSTILGEDSHAVIS